jgi:hypothetical protein
MKGERTMTYAATDTKEYSAGVNIGACVRSKDGKHYAYCEIYYHNKQTGAVHCKTYPASKLDKVYRTFVRIEHGVTPRDEIAQTIYNVK